MSVDNRSLIIASAVFMFVSVTLRSLASRAAALKAIPRAASNVIVEELNEKEQRLSPEASKAHADAVQQQQETYTDPESGLTVFTRLAHIRRGRCCGSHCRHCPYGHVNVPAEKKLNVVAVSTPAPPSSAHHATVYTKTGDKGTSALCTGERRSKSDTVFNALGTLDELNSFIGLATAEVTDTALLDTLQWIQRRLLDIGSVVATPGGAAQLDKYQPDEWTKRLEESIDDIDSKLPPLTEFILPGGGRAAAGLHVCRSVTRRAERELIAARVADPRLETALFQASARFVNRLSDFFFVAARSVSQTPEQRRSSA